MSNYGDQTSQGFDYQGFYNQAPRNRGWKPKPQQQQQQQPKSNQQQQFIIDSLHQTASANEAQYKTYVEQLESKHKKDIDEMPKKHKKEINHSHEMEKQAWSAKLETQKMNLSKFANELSLEKRKYAELLEGKSHAQQLKAVKDDLRADFIERIGQVSKRFKADVRYLQLGLNKLDDTFELGDDNNKRGG